MDSYWTTYSFSVALSTTRENCYWKNHSKDNVEYVPLSNDWLSCYTNFIACIAQQSTCLKWVAQQSIFVKRNICQVYERSGSISLLLIVHQWNNSQSTHSWFPLQHYFSWLHATTKQFPREKLQWRQRGVNIKNDRSQQFCWQLTLLTLYMTLVFTIGVSSL